MAEIPKPYKQIILSAGFLGVATIASQFMMPFEGKTYQSYRDSGGVWTICRGHTHGVKQGQTATDSECDRWYAEDIATAERTYNRLVQKEYPTGVKAASVSFIYNAGPANFARSTILKKLTIGDRVGACNQFPRWVYVDGKNCALRANNCYGIVTRRQKEKELCLQDNFKFTPKFDFATDAFLERHE